MKALIGAFNQEKALVGAFLVIVQQVAELMEHYTALNTTHRHPGNLDPAPAPAVVAANLHLTRLQGNYYRNDPLWPTYFLLTLNLLNSA